MIVSISTKKYWKTFDQILQWNNTIIVLNEPVDCESGTAIWQPYEKEQAVTDQKRCSFARSYLRRWSQMNQIFNLGFRLGFNGNTSQNYVYTVATCRWESTWDPRDPSLEFVSFPFGLFDSIRSFYQNILWRLEFHFDQARAQQIVHKGCYTNL